MKLKGPEQVDDIIHDIMFPLGRMHSKYGSNVIHMDMLGSLMLFSITKTIPRNRLEKKKYDQICAAFSTFFKVIVYWIQCGFMDESSRGFP